VIALSDSTPGPAPGLLPAAINLVGLGLLVSGLTSEAHLGLGGSHLAALLLFGAAVAGWLGWTATRVWRFRHLTLPSLGLMALAGGALATFAPVAVVFVGVAAVGATIRWTFRSAVWIAAAGPLAMLVSVAADGRNLTVVLAGLAASLGGAVIGISRRQGTERTAQAALVAVTEARAEAERARAELLAGRNHLARELHDVLAHTLSALSIQLEALDALISAGPPPAPALREQLASTKRLVREGLDEAVGAVRALREDLPPLENQLARLAEERRAGIEVSGTPRPLSPDVSLALYRVAQESLTNATKHAPGAAANVRLDFATDHVTLSVSNCHSPHPDGSARAGSGGGYGLQGIRERVLLLGGRVEAGPTGSGWRVEAEVPA
jgi:signal transduction histidine kinase